MDEASVNAGARNEAYENAAKEKMTRMMITEISMMIMVIAIYRPGSPGKVASIITSDLTRA